MHDDEIMMVTMTLMMKKMVMVMLDEMMNVRILRWMIEEWVVMEMVEDRWLGTGAMAIQC